MFRTKKDVDRHVQELFRKVKGENERKYKYFNIARLYYQVGDYESTRRYVSSFLSIRDDSASAHKLLGQTLEALGQKETALAEYKCSLMLENNQSELVLKVCELMADSDAALDESTARYWCERAEQLFPHHHLIFKLKEKLVSTNKDSSAAELESLITSEMSARPKDVCLHIKLTQLYLDKGRVKDAYRMVVDVEIRSAFRDDLRWYDCITEVFKSYEEAVKTCGWEFYMHYICALERAVCLNLQEQYGSLRRTWVQGVQALFSLDQMLEIASNQSPPSSEVVMYQELLKHQRAQLCLHLATALFKKAKREPGSWRDVVRTVSPLLLLALVPPIDLHASWLAQATESRRQIVKWWAREAAYRNSQAGHIIVSLVSELRSQFLERVAQFCAGSWRERLFQKIFNTRDHQQAMGSSHFVRFQGFSSPVLQVPSSLELKPHDEMSQMLHPGSLHHLVWLGLRELSTSWGKQPGVSRLGSEFRCLVFENLQFTCSNPNSAGSETLCQLDIDAFLYASVLCAKASLEEEQTAGYRGSDRPQILPANITEQLCSVAQSKWWAAAYRVYLNQARSDLGEVRQTLQRGVEVVRVLGNHGLDVRLIVQLARIFSERALELAGRSETSPELPAIEGRAAMYWTCALPLLDRLQRNQTVRAPHALLFEYQGKELSMAEINMLLEEGRYFLACQLMKEEKHEKAIEAFQQLKNPYASFHQAMIYKKLAAMEVQEQQGELITSEMRSRHVILLTKARECLYLTLDRLRSPGADRKHPLNAELGAHIEEIESQLARIDPDVWRGDVNRNDLEEVSDGSASSPSAGENGNSQYGLYGLSSSYMPSSSRHFHARISSTPYRSGHNHRNDSDLTGHDHSRRTARPSPERLEAQIRQLTHGRDSQMQQMIQHNKAVVDLLKNVAETQNKLVRSVDELKNLMQDLMKKDSHKRSESQMNSDLPHVGDADDDLYVFDDDYSEDVSISANHVGQYQPFPQYPSYANPNYRQLPGMMASSTVPYGAAAPTADSSGVPPPQLLPPTAGMSNFFRSMDPSLIYPQTLSYYGQGALPFSEGQQLPDFRTAAPVPPAPAGAVFSRLGPPPAAAAMTPGPAGDSSKLAHPPGQPAPVNVVITSSDTLPTTVPSTQPTLSVTIPPQHRLGTPLVHAPGPGLPPPGVPPVQVMPAGIPPGNIGFPGIQQPPLQSHPSLATPLPVSSTTTASVPHAFQITMPPQAQVPLASRLEQGAAALSPVLPISTQTLLSSVPSPVYSAVGLDKTRKDQPGTPGAGGTPSSTTPKTGKAHRVSTGSVGESEEGAEEVEQDPCPDFQPVIPLPAEVEVNTGEEQEVSLFECRCKLFRFVDKEWKERGLGVLKILHHTDTGKVRILMRREQVLKVCANHFLTSDMALTRMIDKAWIWVANDFADEQVRLEKLCARFKTVEEAENFADSFREGCELSKKAKATPTKDSSKKPDDKSPTPTPTMNTPPTSISAASSLSSSADVSVSSIASTSPSEKIVLGGFTFTAPPKFTASSQKTAAEKDTSKEKEKSGNATPKPSPFAMFSFNAPTSKASTNTVATAGDSIVSSVKGNTPGFRDTSGCGDVWLDKATTNLPTFSLLATSSSEEAFKKDSSFQGFEGAGSLLFKKNSQDKTSGRADGGRGAGEEDNDEFEPTREFVPVVPLPEVVEVRTGEEEEILVFKERAKLLRFDSDGKQWKERGVGQMNIFKDPKTGRVRLLMRREQVLKVCCNHALTANMMFNSMQTSDRAWTWIAQDYSEGEVKPELLAIKFKTSEQAQAFKNTIRDIQLQMIDNKLPVENPPSSTSTTSAVDTKITPTPLSTAIPVLSSVTVTSSTASPAQQPKRVPDKQAAEVWKCDRCLFSNGADNRTCKSCKTQRADEPKPLDLAQRTEGKPGFSELFKPPPGSWECSSCCVRNSRDIVTCVCCGQSRSGKAATPAAPTKAASTSSNKPLSEVFKPKIDSWECKECYVRNEGNVKQCLACKTFRPGCEEAAKKEKAELGISDHKTVTPAALAKAANTSPNKPLSELFKPKTGSWECKMCYVRNEGNVMQCIACATIRPGCEEAVKEKEKAELGIAGHTFGLSSNLQSSGFTFGMPKKSDDAKEEAESGKTGSAGVPTVFGGFSFGTSTTSSTALGSTWTFGSSTPTSTAPTFGSLPVTSSTENVQSASSNLVSAAKSEPLKLFSFDVKSPSATPFQFGTNGTPSKPFSFGGTDNKANKENVPQESGPRNFVFGSPQKFEFNFSGVRPKSPVKSPKSPGVVGISGGEDDSGSEPDEDEGENIYFQPVVPLPDKVTAHTGEEHEDVLYSHRAKLFRFIGGTWKERGVGDVKILKHKETHKVRLVMRREQVLKLCMNHFLTTDITFSEKDEKSWLWSAPDFSEGQIQQERFAIRFQNKDVAAAFKLAVDDAQKNWGSPSKIEVTPEKKAASDVSQGKWQEPDGGSLSEAVKNLTFSAGIESQKTSDSKGVVRALFKEKTPSAREDTPPGDGEVEVIFELSVTPEEQKEAKRLQLPPNFFAYRRKKPCPGCCGCEPDSDSEEATPASSSFTTDSHTSTSSSIAVGSNATNTTVASIDNNNKFALAPPHFTASSTSTLPSTTSGQTSFLLKPQSSTSSSTATISFGQSLTSNLNSESKALGLPSTDTSQQQQKQSSNVFSQPTPVTSVSTQPSSVFSTFSFSPTKNKDIKPLFGQGAEVKPSIFGQNVENKERPFSSIKTVPFGQTADNNSPIFGANSAKISIFGGSSITTSANPVFGSKTQTIAATSTSTADPPKPSFSFVTQSTPDQPFTFTLSSATEVKSSTAEGAAIKETSSEGPAFLSSVDSGLSFASIASNSNKAAFVEGSQSDTAFSWAGAGTQVFGSGSSKKTDTPKSSTSKTNTPKAAGDNESGEDSGGEAEDSHDPHFEPIIALPDAIEVRTGEEEEVKLFCQRARLYRFDNGQWKERGVGEMKILKHPVRGTYRLLLRREQVYKVVLNQLINSSMEIGPSTYSDKTWVWAGMNFAWDESIGEVCSEPRLEKLAVRFKSSDMALDFRDCVDQCKAELSAGAATPPREATLASVSLPAVVPGTNPPQIAKADSTAGEVSDDEKDEDGEVEEEEEEDDDNESDRNLLFEKRATLEVSLPGRETWELLGMGSLQVFYDNDYFIARIYMEADNSGDVLCNTIIAMNTELEVKGKDCIWTAKDYSSEPQIFRKFKARFSSEKAAVEFRNVFSEGKEIAMQCDMIENMDPSELVEA